MSNPTRPYFNIFFIVCKAQFLVKLKALYIMCTGGSMLSNISDFTNVVLYINWMLTCYFPLSYSGEHIDPTTRQIVLSSFPHYCHSGIVDSARELYHQIEGAYSGILICPLSIFSCPNLTNGVLGHL